MEKRFITPVIISIILLILAVILSFLPFISGGSINYDQIPIIPDGVITDVILTMIIPFGVMVIMLIIGPTFTILFEKIHKKTKLNKFEYFIYESEKKLSSKRILLRAAFGGLLAINLAIYIALNDTLAPHIYREGGVPSKIYATIEYSAVIIGLPMAFILLLPIWMVESSRLMCAKRSNYIIVPLAQI